MLRGHVEKLFVLILLLIAGLSDVSLAVITVNGACCIGYESPTPAAQTAILVNPVDVSNSCSFSLAEIGVELLKAPSAKAVAGNLASVAGLSSDYKVLPTVPAAFVLVLTGFLCVSLVKDRKTWLAAFVGLVCIGQFSISALPKLVDNLRNAFKESGVSSHVSQQVSLNDFNFGILSDVKDTGYIGLLRKLSGIPDSSSNSTFNMFSNADLVCNFAISAQSKLNYEATTFVVSISNSLGLESLSSCHIQSTRQVVIFSPAFIISNLAHGPPA